MRFVNFLHVTTSLFWVGVSVHHAASSPINHTPLNPEATISLAVPSNEREIAEEPSFTMFGGSDDVNRPHTQRHNLFDHSSTSIETNRENSLMPSHLNGTVGFNAVKFVASDGPLVPISTTFRAKSNSKSSKQSTWKKNRSIGAQGFGTDPAVIIDSLTAFKSVSSIPVYELDLGYMPSKSSNRELPTYSPVVGCPALCQVEADCTQLGYSHCVDNCCRKVRIDRSILSKPTSNQVCKAIKT